MHIYAHVHVNICVQVYRRAIALAYETNFQIATNLHATSVANLLLYRCGKKSHGTLQAQEEELGEQEMAKPHHTFYETLDSKGRRCIRLDKRNGRILARWRDDMPGQRRGYYQWAREKNAVLSGYGDVCFDAIRSALYAYGLSDFNPFTMSPEAMQYTAVFIKASDESVEDLDICW